MFRASDQVKIEAPNDVDETKDQASKKATEAKEQTKGFLGNVKESFFGASQEASQKTSSSVSSAKSKVSSSTSSSTKVRLHVAKPVALPDLKSWYQALFDNLVCFSVLRLRPRSVSRLG